MVRSNLKLMIPLFRFTRRAIQRRAGVQGAPQVRRKHSLERHCCRNVGTEASSAGTSSHRIQRYRQLAVGGWTAVPQCRFPAPQLTTVTLPKERAAELNTHGQSLLHAN
jgi:hypothetical protein